MDSSSGPVTKANILVLAADAFGTGGIQRATRTLVQALAEIQGPDRVSLISIFGGDAVMPCSATSSGGAAPGERVGLGQRASFSWAALRAARKKRNNLVIVACHPHISPVAWACGLVARAPVIVWTYGKESWGRLSFLAHWSLRQAEKIVAISAFTAAEVTRAAGLPTGSVVVCPLSLPPDWETQAPQDLTPADDGREQIWSADPSVLAVARLETADAYKGIDTLVYSWLEVASRVPGARLVVVGEGSDRRRLETSARLLGLDGKVMFTGRLTDSELADAYWSAAIFALPSQTRFDPRPEGEGFGLVFIEAGAAGLPVVAGRSGAVSEVVDEESGILVDAESPREVAAAITALLQDRDLARRLGRGGRRKAQTEFSYPAFKERISSLMDEIELAHRSGVA